MVDTTHSTGANVANTYISRAALERRYEARLPDVLRARDRWHNMCIYIYIGIYTHIHCMHIYIYIYIYHTHIHIYINKYK